jgi:preprotein translocase subunit SecA
VLINVQTLRDIDELSQLFTAQGVDFQALDPRKIRNLEEEAESVKRAAQPGAITICSKLAARGTDIVVAPEALDAGGLFVIGLERGIDRRYDDQLRGRTGRHGDPGESVFILSLDDELMTVFGGTRIQNLMLRFGMVEGVPIESALVARRIHHAQKLIQRAQHLQRRQLVEFDDVLERHRLVFYDLRQKVLTKESVQEELQTIMDNWLYFKGQTVLKSLPSRALGRTVGVFGALEPCFDSIEVERIFQIKNKRRQQNLLKETLYRKMQSKLDALINAFTESSPDAFLKYIMLTKLDDHWAGYLRFEQAVRDEQNLHFLDPAGAIAKYAKAMEERFDSFFYEAGEDILSYVLSLQYSVESDAMAR